MEEEVCFLAHGPAVHVKLLRTCWKEQHTQDRYGLTVQASTVNLSACLGSQHKLLAVYVQKTLLGFDTTKHRR